MPWVVPFVAMRSRLVPVNQMTALAVESAYLYEPPEAPLVAKLTQLPMYTMLVLVCS